MLDRIVGTPLNTNGKHRLKYSEFVASIVRSRSMFGPRVVHTKHERNVKVNRVATAFAKVCPGDAARALDRLGIPHDVLRVGGVAHLSAEKDRVTLLEAFALLRAQVPETCLALMGDEAPRAEVEPVCPS